MDMDSILLALDTLIEVALSLKLFVVFVTLPLLYYLVLELLRGSYSPSEVCMLLLVLLVVSLASQYIMSLITIISTSHIYLRLLRIIIYNILLMQHSVLRQGAVLRVVHAT